METPTEGVVETDEMLSPGQASNADGRRACCDDKVGTPLGGRPATTTRPGTIRTTPTAATSSRSAPSVARSSSVAIRASLGPVRQSIACMTRGISNRRDGSFDRLRTTTSWERYLLGWGQLRLDPSILHRIERARGGAWPSGRRSHRAGYRHRVRQIDGSEVIAFDRHPAGRVVGIPFPLLHIDRVAGTLEIAARADVPTGRVPLGAVAAFPIREPGVRPLRPDRETILIEDRAVFNAWRTW